jgi:hypothetical protein
MQERSIPGSRPVLLLEIFLWQVFLLFALWQNDCKTRAQK